LIVSLHMATGAAAGHALGSRLAAVAVGPLLHVLGDRMPHEEVGSRPFEIASGAVAALLLALRRGPLDPATLGALSASAPDLEHVLPFRPKGARTLFPSHRFEGWHRSGGVPVSVQLAAAGFILGAILAAPTARSEASPRRARRRAR
jgi:membrane associated rhomboid family serine protease